MTTRRQEKIASVIQGSVGNIIIHKLDDPRIEGFVSVTKVEIAPDLKNATIYISIFGKDEKKQQLTFKAIRHAHSRIQSLLAKELNAKFCPSLHFKQDTQLKKSIETFNIIDQAQHDVQTEPDPQQQDSE